MRTIIRTVRNIAITYTPIALFSAVAVSAPNTVSAFDRIEVDTLVDTDNPGDGLCSLREALLRFGPFVIFGEPPGRILDCPKSADASLTVNTIVFDQDLDLIDPTCKLERAELQQFFSPIALDGYLEGCVHESGNTGPEWVDKVTLDGSSQAGAESGMTIAHFKPSPFPFPLNGSGSTVKDLIIQDFAENAVFLVGFDFENNQFIPIDNVTVENITALNNSLGERIGMISATSATNAKIHGNTLLDSPGFGIAVQFSPASVFGPNEMHGNTIIGSALAGTLAADITEGSSYRGNTIRDSGNEGMLLLGISEIVVEDNEISGSGFHGMLLMQGTDGAQVRRNSVIGNGATGITVGSYFVVDEGLGQVVVDFRNGAKNVLLEENQAFDNLGGGYVVTSDLDTDVEAYCQTSPIVCTGFDALDGNGEATMIRNTSFGNTGVGIDLTADGVLLTDPDNPVSRVVIGVSDGVSNNNRKSHPAENDNPNNWQNFPKINKAEFEGTNLRIRGRFHENIHKDPADYGNNMYYVEFFLNSGMEREAEMYVDAAEVTTASDGKINFEVELDIPVGVDPAANWWVLSTATEVDSFPANCSANQANCHGTSELSLPKRVLGGGN